MWNDPRWRSLLHLLLVAITYRIVGLWLWKSMENSGNFFLLLRDHHPTRSPSMNWPDVNRSTHLHDPLLVTRDCTLDWLAAAKLGRLVLGEFSVYMYSIAFSALTLLVGQQEGHPACKKLSGYLSWARCRLAYGPADATATRCLLLQ